MQDTYTEVTSAAQPGLRLNRAKLDELRRANGIESEADLARLANINPTTLWRVSTGKTLPSNGFIARMVVAFPLCPMGELFFVDKAAA
ncbi:helix-turn-helix domain-containing protein [Mycetocola spongiae]|uniref:helix-turn-helix domain-containing protein n=1 Tax=Mycetocola spongiae TaxID=2859226 RepID=UPI001CF4BC08|nr:helix-turn-helix transcriptional regulator [Mycetocola spongiae]UCR89285.1 helix-turn-helix domain-containing protein [Mycetocola spongiae]